MTEHCPPDFDYHYDLDFDFDFDFVASVLSTGEASPANGTEPSHIRPYRS
jgi:hypothetical protein